MDRQPRGMLASIVALAVGGAILSVALLPVQAGPVADNGRSVRPQLARRARPLVAQQRTEDRGFSLTLTSPDEAYLVGPLKVTVEPVVPAGDVLEQADFFIDGKLVFTDRVPPYAFQHDFGSDILQHAIVVRARTLDGRAARVAFVSRSADITDSAAGPIEVVPAVVRDPSGRPVVDLTVSDFSLMENGVSRPIIHFDSTPAPVSIVVALHDRDLAPAERAALLRSAAEVGDDLPRHHSLGFVDGAALAAVPDAPDGGTGAPGFSHDRDDYRGRLAAALDTSPPDRAGALPRLLEAAARALDERRGGRALILLTGGPPPPPPPAPAPAPTEDEAPGVDSALEMERRQKEQAEAERRLQELRDALLALQRARVTVNVLLAGNADPDGAAIALLRRNAEESGGEFLVLHDGADPSIAFLRVAESLLNRYLISFQPRHSDRGGDRAIDVRVRRPHLLVKAPTALSGD